MLAFAKAHRLGATSIGWLGFHACFELHGNPSGFVIGLAASHWRQSIMEAAKAEMPKSSDQLSVGELGPQKVSTPL